MPFSSSAQNQSLDSLNASFGAYNSVILYASLHTAYSATGTNEVTGGSPAYARILLGSAGADWSAASAGAKLLGTAPSAFNVPGSTTVEYVGFWSAITSGTFAGMGPVGAGTLYAFTSTSASPSIYTAPGSSFSNNTQVVLFNGAGATISSDFTVGQVYFIVNVSGATFNLSLTSGGSAINSTHAGAGILQSIAPETFGSQGTLQLTTSTALYLF